MPGNSTCESTCKFRRAAAAVLSGLLLATALPGWADPPPWAPAHGWRKKNDPSYQGYTGRTWERDYGIAVGRCDTQAVMAVAGGTLGAVVGSQMGKGDNRVVATIIGATVGAVLGAQIGRELDQADRACIGHALELAPVGHRIVWVNRGVNYVMVPTGSAGDRCRSFNLSANGGPVSQAVGCARGDGTWDIKPHRSRALTDR